MSYVGTRVRRRHRVAGANRMSAAGALGFDWGSFGTSLATGLATNVASVGVQALDKQIIGTPSAPKPVAAPQVKPATAISLSSVPTWAWAAGGIGVLLVLVLALRR